MLMEVILSVSVVSVTTVMLDTWHSPSTSCLAKIISHFPEIDLIKIYKARIIQHQMEKVEDGF